MNQEPKVSILIPVFNRENLITDTISSALSQTYQDFEVVVVDNCSSDGTYDLMEQIAAQDNRVKIFRNHSNLGPVKNWKKCLKYAKGEYIKILFSDDLITKDFLALTQPILENKPDIGFIYSKVEIFSQTEKKEVYRLGPTGEYPGDVFLQGTIIGKYPVPVSPGCALFRKKDVVIYEDIPNSFGLKHGNNGAGIDLLIFLEILNKYTNFYYIDEVLSYFRAHQDSFSVAKDLSSEYQTAKAFYLKKYQLKSYIKSFNSFLLLKELYLQKRWLNKNRILNKYYIEPEESENFTKLSIRTIVYIILRKIQAFLGNHE